MIRILSKEYSLAVSALTSMLDKVSAQYDVYVSQNTAQLSDVLSRSVGLNAVLLVGDTGNLCETLAETFGLALVYDKFAEKNIRQYCKLSGSAAPAQYLLDKYCVLPETFIHYSSLFGMQCGCGGEFEKCHIYVLPDDEKECYNIFENYVKKDLFKKNGNVPMFCFKLFGLSKRDLEDRIASINLRNAVVHCETQDLDSKVTLTFRNVPQKAVSEAVETFSEEFASNIYSNRDKSLAEAVVSRLNELYKTVATAESVTGGLIASSLVGVPGASNVLYEGAVTYTIDSKSNRLGISPHFIDQYGVVSSQVAKEMAVSQLKMADFSVATTGFAGPTSDGKNPVGLCFVAIGAKIGGKNLVKVYKNFYRGDRNSIRHQIANTAMYLLYRALTDAKFFSSKKIEK